MKRLITTVSVLMLAATSPLAVSGHTNPPTANLFEPETPAQVTGSISSIAEDGSMFEIRTPTGVVSVKVDSKTVYLLNGKESNKADALKIGHEVVVYRDGERATRVEAKSEIEPVLR